MLRFVFQVRFSPGRVGLFLVSWVKPGYHGQHWSDRSGSMSGSEFESTPEAAGKLLPFVSDNSLCSFSWISPILTRALFQGNRIHNQCC
ncbi:hypothetical protein HanPI659440_Chr09g0349411 [Helianthus annuus]|nr:hypothetical protein HanPI659440_Chr09g0349411 [Helianthus annuus]